MLRTLRRVGEFLVITIPKEFIDQNSLRDGSQVELSLDGNRMTINAAVKPLYKLSELLAEMSDGRFPMAEGWDEMRSTGLEN